MRPVLGRFVWFDLLTPDPAAAQEFYPALLGWKVQKMGDYAMFMAPDGQGVGGIEQREEVSAWLGHVQVDDVDARLERAEKLGGSTVRPAIDIPKVGRYGVSCDPQGARLSFFKPSSADHPEIEAPPVAWHQLLANDLKKAAKYYADLLEYQVEKLPFNTLFKRGDHADAGVMAKPSKGPSSWMYYFRVDDLPGTCKRVSELGGTISVPPSDIPKVGSFAVALDPQGAHFGLARM